MDLPTSEKGSPPSTINLPPPSATSTPLEAWRAKGARGGREIWTITKAAARRYSRKSGGLLAGSVAFFSLLSIVPVLFIAVSLARLGAREEHARSTFLEELSRWIGPSGAETVADLLGRQGGGQSLTTRILHAAVVVYMSTRLFSKLRSSINHLWDIEPLPAGTVRENLLRKARRFLATFAMVTLVEVLLLAMVVVKTALAVASARLAPHADTPILSRVIETLVSLAVVTGLFAAIFRVLPDARIAWRDLVGGALLTACLFSAGATLVSIYLGHKATDDTFGDGGPLVMLLLWVNYSAQIFFFGVTFTAEWAERRGDGIHPVHGAHRIGPKASQPAEK